MLANSFLQTNVTSPELYSCNVTLQAHIPGYENVISSQHLSDTFLSITLAIKLQKTINSLVS